jgi:hypothetical protein
MPAEKTDDTVLLRGSPRGLQAETCLYKEWNQPIMVDVKDVNECGCTGDACKVQCGNRKWGKRATSCDACKNQTTKMKGFNRPNTEIQEYMIARCGGKTGDCMWKKGENGMPGQCVDKP